MVQDRFGFDVQEEFEELLHQYSAVWVDEECERVNRWLAFLETHAALAGPSLRADGSDPAALAAALLPSLLARRPQRFAGVDPSHPLDALVLGGVPSSLRSAAWTAFLRTGDAMPRPAFGLHAAAALGAPEQPPPPPADPWSPEYYAALVAVVEAFRASHPPAPSSPTKSLVAAAAAATAAAAAAAATAAAAPGEPVASGGSHGQPRAGIAAAQTEEEDAAAALQRAEAAALAAGVAPAQLAAWRASAQSWLSQVDKDTCRTFPGHERMSASGRAALGRLLAAASLYEPGVGYCQGMNFVAGFLLLFAPSEAAAFGCLAGVMRRVLPGYFTPAMIAPQVDQLVLTHLVETLMPDVASHVSELGVDVAAPLTQWWLCCFVASLPSEAVARVWDLLFYEASPAVLFRVALALFEVYGAALLASNDALDVGGLLQHMAGMTFDASRLVEVASRSYAHVTPAAVSELQRRFRPQVLEGAEARSRQRWARQVQPAVGADGEASLARGGGPSPTGADGGRAARGGHRASGRVADQAQ